MPVKVKEGETNNSNGKLNQQQAEATTQTESKFMTVAKELNKKLDKYVSSTSSSENFKKALDEFGGDKNRFNQSLVLFALTLAYMEEAAKKDEELKKSLSSLQEKMKAVNENIKKIAGKLGYTASKYSLDKLMDKNIKEVEDILKKDFGGVEPNFKAIFGDDDVLKGLADLFAEQQQAKQLILEQTASDVNKQNEEYHNPLRGTGKKIAIAGVVLGVLAGVLFAGSMFYLPLAAFGLLGIGLATIGFPLLFIGVVTWVVGLINEANYHSQALKQAERKNTDEEQKEKEEQQAKQPVLEQQASDKNKQNKDDSTLISAMRDGNVDKGAEGPSLAQNNQGNEAPKEKK